MNFYTLSLPRSRSCWISQLLSYGDSYCLHEYLSQNSFIKKTCLPTLPNIKHVGSADTFPIGFNAKLVGDSPLVIIRRNKEEVRQSLINSFDLKFNSRIDSILDRLDQKLNDIRTSNMMTINYEDLSGVNVIRSLIKHVGLDIPQFHINKMLDTNIIVSNNNPELNRKHINNIIGGLY